MRPNLLNLYKANAKRGQFRAEANTLFVYDIIENHMVAALEFLDQEIAERGSADLLRCRATNRKGKACQRVPVTGSDYCPSHRYLEKLQQQRRGSDVLAA